MPNKSAPKRRSRLVERKQNNGKKKSPKILFLLVSSLIIVVIYLLYPQTWDKNTRLSIAIQKETGDVVLATFDPANQAITTINISGETYVSVSRQLGNWRLKSIWQLGEQEKIGGSLLSETVTKAFRLPTETWAANPAVGFVTSSPVKILRAGFSFYKTNLTLKDRISLIIFAFNVKSSDRVDHDLTSYGYTYEAKLPDGEKGYKIRSEIPSKLASIFADSAISKEGVLLTIVDQTGNPQIAKDVGEIVEILGVKIVAIKSEESSEGDCVIRNGTTETTKKISSIFSCKKEIKKTKEGESAELIIGEGFRERF